MSKFAAKQFWIDTLDRVVVSFAQGAVGVLGLDTVGILDVDWVQGLSIAGSYAVLALLTSVIFRGQEDHTILKNS